MKRKSTENDEYSALRTRLGDLSAAFGSEWNECFLNESGLLLPGWKRPFTPAELRSTYMRMQQLNILTIENRRLRKERNDAWAALEAAEDRAEWFRQRLVLESRLGAMLERVAA